MRILFSQWLRSPKAKQLFSLCRWLHLYISATLFSLILLFSLTGLTLNHPEWSGTSPTETLTLELPARLLHSSQSNSPNIGAIQTFITANTGLTHPKKVEVFIDDSEVTLDYPLPAGYAFVTVNMGELWLEVEYKRGGIISLLNDLHKGRHSGKLWAWLIDITAVLSMLFTLTGGILLLQNAKHRRRASIALLFGVSTPVFVFWFAVPQLSI